QGPQACPQVRIAAELDLELLPLLGLQFAVQVGNQAFIDFVDRRIVAQGAGESAAITGIHLFDLRPVQCNPPAPLLDSRGRGSTVISPLWMSGPSFRRFP